MTLSSDQLRAMVREVLREVVPTKSNEAPKTEHVRIGTDTDLLNFVQRVLEQHEAIKAGRLRFKLDNAPVHIAHHIGEVLQGVVTEQIVSRYAGSGALLLAPDTVITPLARDRARKLNLKIERRH